MWIGFYFIFWLHEDINIQTCGWQNFRAAKRFSETFMGNTVNFCFIGLTLGLSSLVRICCTIWPIDSLTDAQNSEHRTQSELRSKTSDLVTLSVVYEVCCWSAAFSRWTCNGQDFLVSYNDPNFTICRLMVKKKYEYFVSKQWPITCYLQEKA